MSEYDVNFRVKNIRQLNWLFKIWYYDKRK